MTYGSNETHEEQITGDLEQVRLLIRTCDANGKIIEQQHQEIERLKVVIENLTSCLKKISDKL